MRALLFLLCVIGGATFAGSARADIAPPVPPPREVKVVIQVDEKAKGPAIVLPQNVLFPRVRPIRPAPKIQPGQVPPGANAPGEEEAFLDAGLEDEVIVAAPEQPKSHTLIAGLALAMSAGFGGLWLVRKNGNATRKLAMLVAGGGVLTASAMVWGNAAPIPQPKAQGKTLVEMRAVMSLPNGGDELKIVLDKETLKALLNATK